MDIEFRCADLQAIWFAPDVKILELIASEFQGYKPLAPEDVKKLRNHQPPVCDGYTEDYGFMAALHKPGAVRCYEEWCWFLWFKSRDIEWRIIMTITH